MAGSIKQKLRKRTAAVGLPLAVPFLDGLFRWVFRSSRVEERWGRLLSQTRTVPSPALFCYWHRWAIHHLYRFSGGGHITMSSRKDAGELGFRVLERHGYLTVRGASGVLSRRGWKDRGGRQALDEMRTLIELTGYDAGLTVDGPHGPPLVVKQGIILLASQVGAPIVPMAVASRPRITLFTWDAMHIPLPFSRMVYLFGEPLYVPRTDDEGLLEDLLRELQGRMIALTERANRWFKDVSSGETPVPPSA